MVKTSCRTHLSYSQDCLRGSLNESHCSGHVECLEAGMCLDRCNPSRTSGVRQSEMSWSAGRMSRWEDECHCEDKCDNFSCLWVTCCITDTEGQVASTDTGFWLAAQSEARTLIGPRWQNRSSGCLSLVTVHRSPQVIIASPWSLRIYSA